MGLFDRITERRALSYQSIFRTGLDTFPPRPESGFFVDANTALRNPAVWAAQRLISNDIATLPLEAFDKSGNRRIPIRPKPSWIEEPDPLDPGITRISHFQQVVLSVLMDGNAYVLVEPDVLNPVRLEVLTPTLVRPHKDPGMDFPVYDVTNQRGQTLQTLTSFNVIHIAPFRKPGLIKGLSPIEAASEGVGIGLAAERYTGRFFLSGASMPGFITVPGDATADQLAEMDRKLRQAKGGWRNAGVLGYLTGGAAYTPSGISPKDSDLSAIRDFQIAEVERIYGIPAGMLTGENKGKGTAGTEQMPVDYIAHCLRHYIEPIEAAYRRLIPGGLDTYLKFNVGGLLRGDIVSRYTAYNLGIRDSFMSVNDVRRLEEWDPIEGGDTYVQQSQMTDIAGTAKAATSPDAPQNQG